MARDGYLILDSDLHMMEPDDLWARYLEGQHRANLPRFFGGQQRKLSESSEDKGNADAIMGMEVQGLAIPAHANATGATASSRELRRRSRARHPHFQIARGRGFDPESTLTAMDIEGVDVAVMYGTRGRQILMHDDLAPDYAAALAHAYNKRGARILPEAAEAAEVRRPGGDAQHPGGDRRGAPMRQGAWRRRRHRHPEPGPRPAFARRGVRAAVDRARVARRADRISSDRQHLAQGRCRAALRRARQLPPDRPCYSQSSRADGGHR